MNDNAFGEYIDIRDRLESLAVDPGIVPDLSDELESLARRMTELIPSL